jgi:hypothetical protein
MIRWAGDVAHIGKMRNIQTFGYKTWNEENILKASAQLGTQYKSGSLGNQAGGCRQESSVTG